MNIKLFYHSLLSDWNHGNAHFLRGYATELIYRGNNVNIFEPHDNWSYTNLIKDRGKRALEEFKDYYPLLESTFYDPETIDLHSVLSDADIVIVHEWNTPELIKKIGLFKKQNPSFILYFHDTHHRAVTKPDEMKLYDLSNYDGVLAFGEKIKNLYLKNKWTDKAWTWHEAADTRIFLPLNRKKYAGDLVWIGNWGDEERSEEIKEFLIEPVKQLKLKASVYGVQYPAEAIEILKDAGITYHGWLPNYKVPEIFARYKLTVHIPRRPYVEALPGIPTIRPFEALASGIPLISAPWNDEENLFTEGKDYLAAKDGDNMIKSIIKVLNDEEYAASLSKNGIEKILKKHTCAHRVDELYKICSSIGLNLVNNQKDSNGF